MSVKGAEQSPVCGRRGRRLPGTEQWVDDVQGGLDVPQNSGQQLSDQPVPLSTQTGISDQTLDAQLPPTPTRTDESRAGAGLWQPGTPTRQQRVGPVGGSPSQMEGRTEVARGRAAIREKVMSAFTNRTSSFFSTVERPAM